MNFQVLSMKESAKLVSEPMKGVIGASERTNKVSDRDRAKGPFKKRLSCVETGPKLMGP